MIVAYTYRCREGHLTAAEREPSHYREAPICMEEICVAPEFEDGTEGSFRDEHAACCLPTVWHDSELLRAQFHDLTLEDAAHTNVPCMVVNGTQRAELLEQVKVAGAALNIIVLGAYEAFAMNSGRLNKYRIGRK